MSHVEVTDCDLTGTTECGAAMLREAPVEERTSRWKNGTIAGCLVGLGGMCVSLAIYAFNGGSAWGDVKTQLVELRASFIAANEERKAWQQGIDGKVSDVRERVSGIEGQLKGR